MTHRIHRLYVPLIFPAGLAPGEGGDYNTLTIARNGIGKPVLRGTALAGAMRNAWRKSLLESGVLRGEIESQVSRFFGSALGSGQDDEAVESPLQVHDCVLDPGDSAVVTRTHHLRDRHLGSVADGGLFALEVCPPGTVTIASFVLHDSDDSPGNATRFLQTLVAVLQGGITLGGKSNRGVGRTRLHGDAIYRIYDLSRTGDYAAWLDDDRVWQLDPSRLPEGEPIAPATETNRSILAIELTLGIPRGQDLLVGDGQGLAHDIEPQRVRGADGKPYWRLPGSTLRGLFRSWIARLAARAELPVADSAERHQQRQKRVWTGELLKTDEMNGNNLGWCFLPESQRRANGAKTECPVAALFGTLFQAGRIHISDAYAACSATDSRQTCVEEQVRRHVAVDLLTGGASEGMLFDNTVLTAMPDGKSPQFRVALRIDNPTQQEARWLARTIRALDLGLLRVGSSKSSGRLALVAAPRATGPEADQFTALAPSGKC